jgi:hypothetical protein
MLTQHNVIGCFPPNAWGAARQATRKERERRDLNVELAVKERRRREAAQERARASNEVESGIERFEDSLRRVQDQVGHRFFSLSDLCCSLLRWRLRGLVAPVSFSARCR